MSARREKRFRRLERRVTVLEGHAKMADMEIDYWRRRAFEAALGQAGQKPKSLLQRLTVIFTRRKAV